MTNHSPDRHHSVEDLIRANWISDEEVAKAVVWLTCNGHDPEGAEFLTRQMLRAAESVRATSSTAIDVPGWVTHVEIEFQGPDPTWPNGTRWQEGMGETVEEAIADAIKEDQ